MKKLLYLMEIDWYWIKQRPQVIAEMLAKDYDITVVYHKEVFVKQSLRKDKDELQKSIPIPAIPFRDKNAVAYRIQKFFFYKIIKKINEFDIVWITHPLLYRYVPRNYQGKIVYDCMDNHEALCNDEKIRTTIRAAEKDLIEHADLILASSSGLMKKVMESGASQKVQLIRNGFVLQEIHPPQIRERTQGDKYKIGYFGTIAEWFDFPLLLESLEEFHEIEYHLWGPVSNVEPPNHPRMILEGVVEHRHLWEKVKGMDCLIMPFKMNDIIRDVDPVKLYEYISMGKTVISVYYEEVERFRQFVYFYDTRDIFIKLLANLIGEHFPPKYIEGEQKKFLVHNTWENRLEIINNCL